MKAFFEEYSLVLVVTVIAIGMLAFSETFKETLQTSIEDHWESITMGE
ncbi:MAG: hypothetical protein GX845_01865 [Erysipelothrix sp.]|nr:hypothetical protein [Erysipelothrix sp.]